MRTATTHKVSRPRASPSPVAQRWASARRDGAAWAHRSITVHPLRGTGTPTRLAVNTRRPPTLAPCARGTVCTPSGVARSVTEVVALSTGTSAAPSRPRSDLPGRPGSATSSLTSTRPLWRDGRRVWPPPAQPFAARARWAHVAKVQRHRANRVAEAPGGLPCHPGPSTPHIRLSRNQGGHRTQRGGAADTSADSDAVPE